MTSAYVTSVGQSSAVISLDLEQAVKAMQSYTAMDESSSAWHRVS